MQFFHFFYEMAISNMNDSRRLLFAMYFLYIFFKFVDKIYLLDGILTSLDVNYTFLAKTTHF